MTRVLVASHSGHRHTLLERYINKGANTGKKNLADVFLNINF